MPRLEGHLHYRNVDVSSIKELARRWYPRAYYNAPDKNGNHRPPTSRVEELQYREAVFVPARPHQHRGSGHCSQVSGLTDRFRRAG